MQKKQFIEKLRIPDEEYDKKWLPVKQKIFSGNKYPELIFNPEYHLYGISSTGLLVKEEIEILQECFRFAHIEEEFILVVEDGNNERSTPQIRLRLPMSQPWYAMLPNIRSLEELILKEHQLSTGCYCVFGSNGTWGKYTSIDLIDMDMDIWAFKDKEFMSLFKIRHRDFPDNINKKFKAVLPKEYHEKIEL